MSANAKRSITVAVLLCLVCAGAFALRTRGLYWPRLHPDEPVIGAWIEKCDGRAYVRERVYPNGFFVLARPVALAARAACTLRNRVLYFAGAVDRIMPSRPDGVMLGRWLSALAGALVCVPVFLLAARVSGSAWAGLFAAALAGAARYPVEHSHYAETDMGALLVLACALWLLAAAADSRRLRWLFLAALCSGFAAGTKFTLGMLLPVVFLAALLHPGHDARPVAGRLGRTGLAILIFAAGFAAANPAVFLDWPWFWGNMALEQKRVFAETALNLGPMASGQAVKYMHHLRQLAAYAKTIGHPWLILAAAGAVCLAGLPARHYWPALLAFPAAFSLYWVFGAPWVRSQEFLFFIPPLAALAAIAVALLWRARNAGFLPTGGAWAARGMALLFAVAAIATTWQGGWRAAEIFGWRDTRLLAHDWLKARAPLDSIFAAESYAEAACCATRHDPIQIRKAEAQGLAFLRGQGADYLLRAASVSGRGLRHPLTGGLYPDFARNLAEFMDGSQLLRAWAPLPPQSYTTFASPALELYGLKRFDPLISLALEPGQPALVGNADQNQAGRQTFFPVGRGLGCAECLLVDRFERAIAVGGPEAPRAPVYLVLSTAERPAVVHYRMRGKSGKVSLSPYDVAAVPLRRRGWGERPFEVVALHAEPAEDVVHIPCYARVAFTISELARIFMDAGREDRLPGYFADAPEALERNLPPAEAFVLASRLGNESAAERLVPAAAAAREALAGCVGLEPSKISVNGVSGFYYNEFARARLQEPFEFACVTPAGEAWGGNRFPAAVRILELAPAGEVTGATGEGMPCRQALTIPALLTRGSCVLSGEIMLRSAGAGGGRDIALSVTDGAGAEIRLVLRPGEWSGFSIRLRADRAVQPRLVFSAPLPGQVRLKNMELRWSLSNTLDSAAADLDLALAWNDMRRGNWPSAMSRLASMPAREHPSADAERLAMRFMCAANLDAGARPAAARDLLAVSPRHYAALVVLADTDSAARASATRLEGNLAQPVAFAPWLSLEGFSFDRAAREVRCVFEAQRSGAPGLAVSLWLKRRGEWRRKQSQAISPARLLNRGERAEVIVLLNDRFAPATEPDDLALGLETDVEWHPGTVPPAGERDTVIPFSRLLKSTDAAPADK